MGEYETRFGYIYAEFTTVGQAAGTAAVTVFIDDATRRPHNWGTFTVAMSGQSEDAYRVALAVATEHMGREYGIAGMTWNPSYRGFRGCQHYPDTQRPVNGRTIQGAHSFRSGVRV